MQPKVEEKGSRIPKICDTLICADNAPKLADFGVRVLVFGSGRPFEHCHYHMHSTVITSYTSKVILFKKYHTLHSRIYRPFARLHHIPPDNPLQEASSLRPCTERPSCPGHTCHQHPNLLQRANPVLRRRRLHLHRVQASRGTQDKCGPV
jgi:hypothetical protein